MQNKSKNKTKRKVLVAISGGVDSSVAAKLLVDRGYDVAGVFLHFWREDCTTTNVHHANGNKVVENKGFSAKAFNDARQVCREIGIPLYALDFSKIFKSKVVADFIYQYKIGRTPNPCVICNKEVKLGWLIKKAKRLGFDYVATGHYVKKSRIAHRLSLIAYKLFKAKDKAKDQSYFLYTLNQSELAHLLFPLGGYTKMQVRAMAKKFKLHVAEKRESQEICFIPGKSHNDFLKRHINFKPGAIKTLAGKTIGQHQGLPLYTLGQRQGIKIGGPGPYFVVRADYKTNNLYVTNKTDDSALFSKTLIAKDINWISDLRPKLPFVCEAVIRYHHRPIKCIIEKNKSRGLKVLLSKPQRAVTPGQSVAFYHDKELLGGGIIK